MASACSILGRGNKNASIVKPVAVTQLMTPVPSDGCVVNSDLGAVTRSGIRVMILVRAIGVIEEPVRK